jgi:hypothetical protein
MKLDAYTDWFIVACSTLLTFQGEMPWEATAAIFGGVAGLAGWARRAGKGGGTAVGLVAWVAGAAWKKVAIAIGLSAMLFGCGTGITAGQAVQHMLPVAAETLRELARAKGVDISEQGAVCFEAPEIELEQFEGVGIVALVCAAPYTDGT